MVLAGLFGMHGLDSHGAAGTETVPQAVMAKMSMSPSLSDLNDAVNLVAADAGSVLGLAQRPPEVVSAWPPMGMDMNMAMTCVAILAVALIALLRCLLTSRAAPVLGLMKRQSVPSVRPGRDADPPSLIDLSIQRC